MEETQVLSVKRDKEDTIPFPDEGKEAKTEVRAQTTRRRRQSKKDEEEVPTRGVITKSVCAIFNMVSRLVRSDARFKPAEFDAMSEGLGNLAEKIYPLRLILKYGSAISILDTVYEKVEAIREGRQHRAEREAAEQAQQYVNANHQPTGV